MRELCGRPLVVGEMYDGSAFRAFRLTTLSIEPSSFLWIPAASVAWGLAAHRLFERDLERPAMSSCSQNAAARSTSLIRVLMDLNSCVPREFTTRAKPSLSLEHTELKTRYVKTRPAATSTAPEGDM